MPKKVTSKKPLYGNLRSHACNATRHAQKPNLQKVTLEDGSSVRVSTRELRTLRKSSNKVVEKSSQEPVVNVEEQQVLEQTA